MPRSVSSFSFWVLAREWEINLCNGLSLLCLNLNRATKFQKNGLLDVNM